MLVVPSSYFVSDGPVKSDLLADFRAHRAKILCKHFQESLFDDPWCPKGRDCVKLPSDTRILAELTLHVRRQHKIQRAEAIFVSILRKHTGHPSLDGLHGTAPGDRPADLSEAVASLEERGEWTVRNWIRVLLLAYTLYSSDQPDPMGLRQLKSYQSHFKVFEIDDGEHEPDEEVYSAERAALSSVDTTSVLEDEVMSNSGSYTSRELYTRNTFISASNPGIARPEFGRALQILESETDLSDATFSTDSSVSCSSDFDDSDDDMASEADDEEDVTPVLSEDDRDSRETTPLATPALARQHIPSLLRTSCEPSQWLSVDHYAVGSKSGDVNELEDVVDSSAVTSPPDESTTDTATSCPDTDSDSESGSDSEFDEDIDDDSDVDTEDEMIALLEDTSASRIDKHYQALSTMLRLKLLSEDISQEKEVTTEADEGGSS
ncbi:hypothetical protein OIV83_005535 [Microbotryomycetes sp. JL201]|nr:hypothetical protein OIV83_005535 [Microbotryomycetes sp. JL201]